MLLLPLVKIIRLPRAREQTRRKKHKVRYKKIKKKTDVANRMARDPSIEEDSGATVKGNTHRYLTSACVYHFFASRQYYI